MLATLGCRGRVEQCNELVSHLNASAKEMEALRPNGDDLEQSAEVTRQMVGVAQRAVGRLVSLDLADPHLQAQAAAYKDVLDGMARGTERLAAHIEGMAKLEMQANGPATAKLEATRRTIEGACAKLTSDCRKVIDVMATVPTDPSESEFAGVLNGYAAGLESLALGSPLDRLVSDHVIAIREFEKLIEDAAELQHKADEGRVDLDAIIVQEQKLVSEINRYCVGPETPTQEAR